MMMHLTETIRKYLGWCPNEETLKTSEIKQPEWLNPSAGMPGGGSGSELGWYKRYHNQLLAMAVILTLVTTALFFIFDTTRNVAWKGLLLGIFVWGLPIFVILWSSWKRYDRIEKGTYVNRNNPKKQRSLRNLHYIAIISFSLSVIINIKVVTERPFIILAVMTGFCIAMWMSYLMIIFWEKRRRRIVMWEKNSLYCVDSTHKKPDV